MNILLILWSLSWETLKEIPLHVNYIVQVNIITKTTHVHKSPLGNNSRTHTWQQQQQLTLIIHRTIKFTILYCPGNTYYANLGRSKTLNKGDIKLHIKKRKKRNTITHRKKHWKFLLVTCKFQVQGFCHLKNRLK